MAPATWESSNWTFLPNSSNATTPAGPDTIPLLECNHQPYDWFSYIIRVLLMVPVLIFGFAANAMNVIIFRQEHMRTSMVNWYLVALAITDVGVLFSSFCMLSLPVICEDFDSLFLFNLGVIAQKWTYALGLTMQTASVGMTVLVSAHRFLGVVFPFRAQQWCTSRRVKVAMWSVAIFAVSFNIPRWFEIDVDACQSSVYNATALRLVLSNLRLDDLYYNAYMVILYTLFMFALPFLLLIIMNALIVRTVHRSYRLRQMMTNKISSTSATASAGGPSTMERRKPSQKAHTPISPPQQQQQQYERTQTANVESGMNTASSSTTSNARENKTTIMLIAVVFMFLLCNSLAFINNILEVLTAHGVPVMEAYLTSVELSNFLVVINSASNIFIYWTFSARYRLLFRRYMSYVCCCFPHRQCASLCLSGRNPKGNSIKKTAIVAVAVQGDRNSPPNRLLMVRKNNGGHDVSPSLDVTPRPPSSNTVSLRQNGIGSGAVETASITRKNSLREAKQQHKPPRRQGRFRHIQRQASQPQENPLLEAASSSDSESHRSNSKISREVDPDCKDAVRIKGASNGQDIASTSPREMTVQQLQLRDALR